MRAYSRPLAGRLADVSTFKLLVACLRACLRADIFCNSCRLFVFFLCLFGLFVSFCFLLFFVRLVVFRTASWLVDFGQRCGSFDQLIGGLWRIFTAIWIAGLCLVWIMMDNWCCLDWWIVNNDIYCYLNWWIMASGRPQILDLNLFC